MVWFIHIVDGRVTTVLITGVFLKRREYQPTPLSVDVVLGDLIQVEKGLDKLRAQKIVGIVWLENE